MCHYCGTSYPVVKSCAQCGHTDFHQRNFGTEQLQEVLENLLPDATVGRMDTDSVRGKHSHDTLIQQFEQQKIQVLAGTQMVVKGLDFDHVGMVCIPDADALLHFADFRVNERAFQLIEQVSGRAGRRDTPGRVAIQLTDTNHPLLPFLQQHDYQAFFNWELNSRKAFDYPPFTRIILLQTRHKDKGTCHAAMHFITAYLEKRVGSSHLKGPAEPPVSRIRNLYIMELLLKVPAQANLLQQTKKYIRDAVVELMAQPGIKAARVSVDVDAL
jgi:primosomal protein N' (replication factor Y)